MEPKIRRSAGMRGSPADPLPEHGAISTTPKARPEAEPQPRVSTSPYARPKVLMGEVTAPLQKYAASGGGGQLIAAERDAFRAFMTAHRLNPSAWANKAGVPANEILAFLTGRTRTIAPQTLEKLARAAGVTPQDLFQ